MTGADKLVGAELREFASAGAGERVSVLVELDAPTPTVTVGPGGRPDGGPPVPVEVSEPAGDRGRLQAAVAQARALLEQLTGEQPVWLGAARAFSARVTAEELRRLVASPLVRRVSRNRRIG